MFFVYCTKCGFYPGNANRRISIPKEPHAENLSSLHRDVNLGHETFLVPNRWVEDTDKTHHADRQ